MNVSQLDKIMSELTDGRTELVFDILAAGQPAAYRDQNSVSLMQHCAYYGDVSAIRYLLAHGESLNSLGTNLGLNAASFHGHWRLCKFLLEHGADVNQPDTDTGETPLHAALSKTDRLVYDRVLEVLLSFGADPNIATKPDVETGAFMRDCRTKGETPLHRAAAFGEADTISLLLNAGARIDARDMNGDTPLGWASWYLRPDPILRLLLYGNFRIHPQRQSMRAYLLGKPQV
ncbi:ankyrin repeat domain-containing protein [Alloacidobacterium dinghuense]|uniref:Ankyrin repeat domain-containing protein n=1 Tax=Alloacidobacterium dinghuense TaxID=2763107 RepID=A0A7G8BIK6_9BACT|nr:ankyrin repeat domain-containing protein [Alloacidobacterium dinghuense]QNI32376.1 ankyrin repeat domain-containing protein [Alloacidobacterium dinghuense]